MNDVILSGGTILTLDVQHPQATALAIRGGEVIAVGDEEVRAESGKVMKAIDHFTALHGEKEPPRVIDRVPQRGR